MTTSHHYRTVPPWVQKRREQARFEKQVMRRFDALAAEYRAINLALSAGKTMDDITQLQHAIERRNEIEQWLDVLQYGTEEEKKNFLAKGENRDVEE